MTLGLVGRKVGMTRVFDEQGVSVPVTVLDREIRNHMHGRLKIRARHVGGDVHTDLL